MGQSFEIFRFKGVPVRVHPSLIAVAVLLLLLAGASGGTPAEIGWRLLSPIFLFLTVIAHELGHSVVASALKVRVVDIVLTPFGGAARLEGKLEDGRKEALIAAAGPITNLAVAAATWGLVILSGLESHLRWRELLLLEQSVDGFYAGHPLVALLGFNLLLGTLNLLPAFPLDGGRILRGALATRIGRRDATRFAARVGFWMAVGLCILPFFLDGSHWWLLPFIGVFIVFSGFKERLLVEAGELVFKASFEGPGSAVGDEGRREWPQDRGSDRSGDTEVIDVDAHVIDEGDGTLRDVEPKRLPNDVPDPRD